MRRACRFEPSSRRGRRRNARRRSHRSTELPPDIFWRTGDTIPTTFCGRRGNGGCFPSYRRRGIVKPNANTTGISTRPGTWWKTPFFIRAVARHRNPVCKEHRLVPCRRPYSVHFSVGFYLVTTLSRENTRKKCYYGIVIFRYDGSDFAQASLFVAGR